MARFIAIDWDQNQLHLVAGAIIGKQVKIHHASVWNEAQSPNPGDAEGLGKLLKDRLKEVGIAPAPLLACIGRDRLQVKDLRYPAVPAPEEPAVVRFQAFKELTEAADEVVLDYAPGQPGVNAAEKRSLVMIARRLLVKAYQDMAKAAGLKLLALTPRPFAISATARSQATLNAALPDSADATIAVVTVAEQWAEFCVYRGPQLLLARALAHGPNLAADIRRSLTVHGGQYPQSPVGTLYLAGASAELRETLADMLPDMPLAVLDPFGRQDAIELPPALRGSFAGAAGLLFAKAESQGLPINFVSPRQPRAPGKINYRYVAIGVTAAAVVMIATYMITNKIVADQREQADLKEKEARVKLQKFLKIEPEVKKVTMLDEVQTVVWADELESLWTHMDLKGLRVDSLTADPLPHKENEAFVAKLSITGVILPTYDRKVVDKLVDAFRTDLKNPADPHTNYYSPDSPKVENDKFTVTVKIKRRPPADFKLGSKG